MLLSKIQQDQIDALKNKEDKRLSVLRFLLADLQNAKIEKQKDLEDEEIINIIRKGVKKLEEAAVMFEKGGRPEMAQDNKDQVAILSSYLPEEISDADLESKIKTIIDENRALFESNPRALIGILMGKLKSEAAGSRIMAAFTKLSS